MKALCRLTIVACGALLLASPPAGAASPVAMVEDVTGTASGVGPLDYVSAGRSIKLGAADRLVLDYLHPCIRETITGSSVIVGSQQSLVQGGKVIRENVSCDGGQMQLTADQSQKSEAIVFRKATSNANLPPAQHTLYGLSPLLELPGAGQLTIERLDKSVERISLAISAADLANHHFYDFARHDRALAGGGLYRASFGSVSVVFRLADTAVAGVAPPMTRLLRL